MTRAATQLAKDAYAALRMDDAFRSGMAILACIGSTHLFSLLVLFASRPCSVNMLLHATYAYQVVLRSFFPSEYYHQRVVYASFASSILLARLCATIGETAFVVLIGRFLLVRRNASPELVAALFVLNLVAQSCATAATVLKRRRLFVVEGAVWTAIFLILFKTEADARHRGTAGALALIVAYMLSSYLPFCVAACGGAGAGVRPSLTARIYTAAFRVSPSTDGAFWAREFSWQIPYFALGPLVSLGIVLDLP